MSDGAWVCLFSGGKDSAYALHLARERGLAVERLLTVHAERDSYMYHVPATDLAALAAESIGIDLVEVETGDLGAAAATDAGAQGDAEIAPLEAALRDLDATLAGGIAGVVAGAVESEFQADRIEAMAARLDAGVFAPLWHRDPVDLGREMVAAGFEIRVVRVAAAGLDETWLGRTLDERALADLEALNEAHGVHVLGEGGEFETLVTDGPHMARPLLFESEPTWDGTRGRLRITDARLG